MANRHQFSKILLLFSAIALCGCQALSRNSSSTDLQLALADQTTPDGTNPTHPAGTSGGNPGMVAKILEARCTSCHTESGKPENGINYITDLTRLQDMGYIIPGNAKDSEILKVCQGMGAPCTSAKISDEEIAEVADYINSLK